MGGDGGGQLRAGGGGGGASAKQLDFKTILLLCNAFISRQFDT